MVRREVPLPGVRVLPNGKAEATFSLVSATGKRRQLRRRFPDLASANRWRREMDARKAQDRLSDDEGLTVAVLVERWLTAPSARRGGSTRAAYRSALTTHVLPGLGSVRVSALTTMRLQRHFDDLIALGRPTPVLSLARKALSGALKQAVAWGILERNPVAGVVLPTPCPAEAVALSLDEANRLIAALEDEPVCGALLTLLLYTGLRVGEARALGWDDVDLDRGVLTVRRRDRKSVV